MKNLPLFTIRESSKARRVILKISALQGLEVVIPLGFSRRRVKQIIREKQDWIERAFRKIQATGALPEQPRQLPDSIYLEAVGRAFAVEYISVPSQELELIHEHQASLAIRGGLSDLQGCQALLKRWLNWQGRIHLIPWVARVSAEIGLSCRTIQIRSQKSRWGSCSSWGTISLNQNLLFLRPALVRYLIIHELCHTVHLNHSPSFYELQASFLPDYQELRAEIRQVRDRVPWWAA